MSDSVPDLPISCATGDCTWPIIPTLGMCGACMDMKRYLEIIPCTGSSKGNCNFSIPGGLTLSKPRTLLEWNDTTPVFTAGPGSGLIFNQTDVVGEEPIYEGISFDFIGQSYSEFMEANRGTYSPGNETLFTEGNVLAYECGLWYCLQARSVNASNGIVKDSVINHRNWVALGTWTNRTQPKYSFQNDPSFDANDTNVNDYSGSMSELTHTLRGALSGSITISANWDVDYDWGELPWDRKYGYYNGFGPAADCLHAAWKYADDIDGWWERLAKSMTNNIRLNGYLRVDENDSFGTKDDGRYDGIAWTSVVHVEVRWLWLIFPAALVLSSTTFLVATMVASQQSNLRPWKSFILPVLYTRLEDGLQDEWTQEYAHDDTLLSEVTNRWVGLDNCEDSWVFRHVTKELKKMHQIRFAGDTSVDG